MSVEKIEKAIPLSQIHWQEYLTKKDYNKDPNKMCDLCKKDQVKRYGKITIPCKGLATTPPEHKKLLSSLTAEEKGLVEQLYNPYAWALANIKETVFKARWYQELATRCTARNNVFRWGRRSGKSRGLALKALHRLYMNPGTKILMLAPQETHVKEFAEILDGFTFGFKPEFDDPEKWRTSARKKPYYEINYRANEDGLASRFRGIIAAEDAKTVRGQEADIIILDEVDYISEEALMAIVAIRMDNPNVELWVASTPAGKKTLHKYEQDPAYKAWHFPSFVIPHYDETMDKELKAEYGTGIGYVHEVMAEYGEDELGVFQSYFLDNCRTDKSMDSKRADVLINRHNYIVICGIDWNDDKIGTRIMSVAFDRIEKKFFVASTETVTKDGWTQVEAVQKLIELNRLYRYEKIYLDEGFGVSTIQFIKKYALSQFGNLSSDHPDLKLAEVVGINFSSNIEIRDVETSQLIKKDMKSYIVENAIRYLERKAYMFDNKHDASLMEQMGNYVILRTAPSGKKVYGASIEKIGDHDLDAFMLAMLGFTLEYQEASLSLPASGLIAGIPRDGGPSNIDLYSMLNGIEQPEDNMPNSQFNNIFVPFDMGGVKEKSHADFYDKYILNGRSEKNNGLTRSMSRSQFKK